jgi:chemotaxis protein MotA
MKAFDKDKYDLREEVLAILALAQIARREGLLALESAVDEYTSDAFVKRGILLIVDGADEEQLRNSLEGTIYFMKLRHQKNAAMMEMIAATAPALGLLGTYVGLIPMLVSISDPSALGPMMALELVSSFYGAFLAYVVFSPLAKRLKVASGEEELRREVLIEGMVAILLGKNPRLIKEELEAYTNLDLDTEEEKQRQRELEQEERAANGYN